MSIPRNKGITLGFIQANYFYFGHFVKRPTDELTIRPSFLVGRYLEDMPLKFFTVSFKTGEFKPVLGIDSMMNFDIVSPPL